MPAHIPPKPAHHSYEPMGEACSQRFWLHTAQHQPEDDTDHPYETTHNYTSLRGPAAELLAYLRCSDMFRYPILLNSVEITQAEYEVLTPELDEANDRRGERPGNEEVEEVVANRNALRTAPSSENGASSSDQTESAAILALARTTCQSQASTDQALALIERMETRRNHVRSNDVLPMKDAVSSMRRSLWNGYRIGKSEVDRAIILDCLEILEPAQPLLVEIGDKLHKQAMSGFRSGNGLR